MDKYEAIVAFTGIIFGTGSAVAMVYFIAQAIGKLRKPAELPEGGLHGLEQRLERMEQAIDAMAVEMERVAEGQRFTTKLLSDRSQELVERKA